MEEVVIEKLVHGGQGLATLSDGRKVFVWNALPGERLRVRIIKKKRSYVEAIAEEVIEASPERISPREENYLATSPWQIMSFEAENRYKAAIVRELFAHEKVELPKLRSVLTDEVEWQYRNKMEYSFWGGRPPDASSSGLQSPDSGHSQSAARRRAVEYVSSHQTDSVSESDNFASEEKRQAASDDGLHLALFRRGSHSKHIVTGSALALPAVDGAANAVLAALQKLQVRAGDLKTVIIRASQKGEVAASLFVKPETFPDVPLPEGVKGLRVYHSNPKSPASVPTKLLQEQGSVLLHDVLLGRSFMYDADAFFQVNIPVFELALARIKEYATEPSLTDMYAGVGSIGLSVASQAVDLIELDSATAAMARENAHASGLDTRVIETSTEQALEYITPDKPVVFDPPRAGLHAKVVDRVLETTPEKVVYLSCNPATQARDLVKLQAAYEIADFEVLNFFPRTPHIETLAILKRKV